MPSQEALQRLAVSENGFVFDPVTGNSFTVNSTGLRLLRLLQQNKDLVEIAATVQSEYDADPREAERDILEFVALLRKHNG
ncbi:MAG: PqqD family protein [Nitrospirae bacterium]|nr:PqqD family protein [Nitrospirota bacterium]MBI3393271.1 PqqD family protein [Nitrospirota bacterium]